MGYQNPYDVVAPKNRWRISKVICNTGQGGWSLAEGTWDGSVTLAIRWNGNDGPESSSGNPQSTGHPTWFILPEETQAAILEVGQKTAKAILKIQCQIERPDDFGERVFRICVRITDKKLKDNIVLYKPTFLIPTWKSWIIRFSSADETENYFSPPHKSNENWRGKFIDGLWQGILQSNGYSVEENSVTTAMIEDQIKAAAAQALVPYLCDNNEHD